MKKLFIIAMMVLASTVSFAQNYDTLYIVDHNGETRWYCTDSNDGIIVYGRPECPQNEFAVNGELFYEDFVVIINNGEPQNVMVLLTACANSYGCVINYTTSTITNPFAEPYIWKRTGESTQLYAPGNVVWSTGETEHEITVTEPGTYSVTITDACGSQTFSVEVRDNVEIYRSGVDPATNKNRVLWQTTSEQAEYISNVKVERDGMVVGTVPYTDGQFLDNIGSENAARIYRITGIASDGTECPLPSYQFGTFNTIISPDIANPSLMNFTWEDPFIEEGSPYSIVAYRIGRFNEATGEFIAIDQVSAQVHIAKYNMDLFDGDYGLVAAVFNDAKNRDYEELAFSNRSDSGIVGINEQNGETFEIYPNPAKDRFTIEGTGTMTVTNTLGQTVLNHEIDGKATIELPQGLYFVKLGETVRKVVVE